MDLEVSTAAEHTFRAEGSEIGGQAALEKTEEHVTGVESQFGVQSSGDESLEAEEQHVSGSQIHAVRLEETITAGSDDVNVLESAPLADVRIAEGQNLSGDGFGSVAVLAPPEEGYLTDDEDEVFPPVATPIPAAKSGVVEERVPVSEAPDSREVAGKEAVSGAKEGFSREAVSRVAATLLRGLASMLAQFQGKRGQ